MNKPKSSPMAVGGEAIMSLFSYMFFLCNVKTSTNYDNLLNKRPFVHTHITGHVINSLVDSGACISAMSAAQFKRLKGYKDCKNLGIPKYKRFSVANGQEISVIGGYLIPMTIHCREFLHETYIINCLSVDLILGIDMINKAGMIINGKTRKVIMGDDVISNNFYGNEEKGLNLIEYHYGQIMRKTEIPGHTIACVNITGPDSSTNDFLTTPINLGRQDVFTYSTITKGTDGQGYKTFIANASPDPLILDKGTKITNLQRMNQTFRPPKLEEFNVNPINPAKAMTKEDTDKFLRQINLKCPIEYRQRYNNLFSEFHDIFSKTEYDLGWTDKVSHRIRLKHNRPINTKQFKIPFPHQQIIHEFVEDMLDKKLIEVSRSRYNSPIFCVRKKNDKWRPVVDLRAINKETVDDFFSIRDVKQCIDEIGRERSAVFSSMDLSKGFFQQNLDKNSRQYTAFTVPGLGSYQFTVSCFGSHGAPSSFCYLMTEVLRNLKNIISYIDDILAHTKTHEEHIVALRKCFMRL